MSEKPTDAVKEIIEKIEALPVNSFLFHRPQVLPYSVESQMAVTTDDLKRLADEHTALREKAAALVDVLNDDFDMCLNGDGFGKVFVAKFYDELAALRAELENL